MGSVGDPCYNAAHMIIEQTSNRNFCTVPTTQELLLPLYKQCVHSYYSAMLLRTYLDFECFLPRLKVPSALGRQSSTYETFTPVSNVTSSKSS